MKKGFPALAALLLLLLPLCVFAENDFYTEMPYYLRIKQRRVEEKPYEKVYLMRTYPESTNGEVDREISELVDKMAEEDRDLLPNRKMEDTVELSFQLSTSVRETREMPRTAPGADAMVFDLGTPDLEGLLVETIADTGMEGLLP